MMTWWYGMAIALPCPACRARLARSASSTAAYVPGVSRSSHSSSVAPKLKLIEARVLTMCAMRPSGAYTRAATTAR